MSKQYIWNRTTSLLWTLILIAMPAAMCSGQAAPTTHNATVEKLIADLGSPDGQVRTAADTSIYMLPPENFEELEAASKRDDLNPEAAMRLKLAVTRIRPWVAARRRKAAETLAMDEYLRRTCLEAYDNVGKKDRQWDDAVRDGIRRFFGTKALQPTARRRFDFAIKKGCEDPLVLYLDVQLMPRSTPAEGEVVDKLFGKAVDSMEESEYPPERKVYAMLRYYSFKLDYERKRPGSPEEKHWDQTVKLLNRMIVESENLWPDVCARPGIPKVVLLGLANDLVKCLNAEGRNLGDGLKLLEEPLLKVLPNDSMPLLLKGQTYISWAWQARGNGYANTVTPEGWKLMGERLAVAEEALTRAWELDHNNAEAAVQMLSVVLGADGDRKKMELWFKRATDADPDYQQSYSSKIYFLEPKWHGSADEMLAFGHECREGRNWYAGTPFILVGAHESLSKYGNADDYFKNEQVWLDIQSIYEPYLSVLPNDSFTRSRYTYYACRCGKWSEAHRQFQLLGAKAVPAQFGNSAAMEHYRQLADANGGSSAP